VELPHDNYALVPEAKEGGADAELQYVEMSKDTKDPQDNCADEGKPQCINLYVFEKLHNYLSNLCVYVQELKWNPRCMIPRYLCSY
jgi:hypothetical protein